MHLVRLLLGQGVDISLLFVGDMFAAKRRNSGGSRERSGQEGRTEDKDKSPENSHSPLKRVHFKTHDASMYGIFLPYSYLLIYHRIQSFM